MLDPVILIVVGPTAIIAFVITAVVVRALAKSPEIREKIVIPIIVSKWLLGVLWCSLGSGVLWVFSGVGPD